jgi:hypothetical protein
VRTPIPSSQRLKPFWLQSTYGTAEQAAEKIAHLTTGAKAEHLKQYART